MIFLISYLVGAIISFGLNFAFFQKKWPSLAKEEFWVDVERCGLMALFSVIGILVFVMECEFMSLLYPTPSYYRSLFSSDKNKI